MAKYKISKRIGRGGMAEVFLAVQEGIGGFEKLVVVKRIFPQFCNDEHFVAMFLQEARLAASIRHPNVVHINDIDRDENGYFLVMEYLPGESLAYCWESLKTRKMLMPPNIVCRIGASIAAGLHHAHIATDAAGHPQPIVHRDVTPSNLIVCYNGMVKIVDFGVAKATLAEGQTRGGALKGKMSYLSPEQVRDEPIDGRTDVFQLGICLHEMLTGRRLFRGKTDHNKITAVMEKDIVPPSQFNPRVPRILDEVVLRALSRDKMARHGSAEELRRDLDNALGELGNVVADADVGVWMRETFADRQTERSALERECVAEVREGRTESGAPLSGMSSLSEVKGLASPQHTPSRTPTRTPTHTPTMATVLERQNQSQSVARTSSGGSGRTALWAAIATAALVIIASLFAWQSGKDSESSAKVVEPPVDGGTPGEAEKKASAEPETTFVHITVTPETAEIFLDGERIGIGYAERRMVTMDDHQLRVVAVGYETFEETFSGAGWPRVVRLKALEEKKPAADLSSKAVAQEQASNINTTEENGNKPSATRTEPSATRTEPRKRKPPRIAKPDRPEPTPVKEVEAKEPDKKAPPKDDFIRNTDNINPFD